MNFYKSFYHLLLFVMVSLLSLSACQNKGSKQSKQSSITAAEILGNPDYIAISYGGYREKSREIQPTIAELKEDMKILSAMGVKLLRTYNLQLEQAPNLLKAIRELQQEDAGFEMYVMLGAWIDCENAWTDAPNHEKEDEAANANEIQKAVTLANAYPEIVKIIAVGNEAMVHWAWSYFVQPGVILKWVNHLQDLKQANQLPKDLWITSSDNFASWGGGDASYHNNDLEALINAVDFLSVHTYPFHDTHYNAEFWKGNAMEDSEPTEPEHIEKAMQRAHDYAVSQYNAVKLYVKALGVEKPIHIGETGWASISNGFYGPSGSKAADEYKQALYYKNMRAWTAQEKITCFFFEAFNEKWKDATNPEGSENHFGLFTIDGKAKFAIWELVDNGIFNDLTRNGKGIDKTYNGDLESLLKEVFPPPKK